MFFLFKFECSEQTDILLREIHDNELNSLNGTHLQKLISRFTLNTICGMRLAYLYTCPNIIVIISFFVQKFRSRVSDGC